MANEYGAINVQSDEETGLDSTPSTDGSSVFPDIKKQRKRQLGPFVALLSLLAVTFFVSGSSSGYSSLDATGAVIEPVPAAPFDWMKYGTDIATYWEGEKVKWNETITELTAANATPTEIKAAVDEFKLESKAGLNEILNSTEVQEALAVKAKEKNEKKAEKVEAKALKDESKAQKKARKVAKKEAKAKAKAEKKARKVADKEAKAEAKAEKKAAKVTAK